MQTSLPPNRTSWPPLWRDILAVVLIATFSGGLGIWVRKPCGERVATVGAVPHPAFSLAQFRGYVEERKVLVLDARDAGVFLEGHVPGALSLPVSDFDRAYEAMRSRLVDQQDKLIIVYCSDLWCGQADMLQQKLINVGFHHVGRFPDGWAAWVEAGFPKEK